MSAEMEQLKIIDPMDFLVQSIGESTYLNLVPLDKETSPSGAVLFSGKLATAPFELWLKSWNIEDLIDIQYKNVACVSRKLTAAEIELFEFLRSKMIRCKMYGQNYYENSLMEKI